MFNCNSIYIFYKIYMCACVRAHLCFTTALCHLLCGNVLIFNAPSSLYSKCLDPAGGQWRVHLRDKYRCNARKESVTVISSNSAALIILNVTSFFHLSFVITWINMLSVSGSKWHFEYRKLYQFLLSTHWVLNGWWLKLCSIHKESLCCRFMNYTLCICKIMAVHSEVKRSNLV